MAMPQCTAAELEAVMDRYGGMVYRLAYAQTRSKSDADDLYQEVFLRYFQKAPAFESEDHRRAWLLRVTVNCVKKHWNSAWFRHTVPLEDRYSYTSPEESALDAALETLPPKYRTVLHLFYYEDCSVAEMSRLLNCRESTLRTQLTRARRLLAQRLEDFYDV